MLVLLLRRPKEEKEEESSVDGALILRRMLVTKVRRGGERERASPDLFLENRRTKNKLYLIACFLAWYQKGELELCQPPLLRDR